MRLGHGRWCQWSGVARHRVAASTQTDTYPSFPRGFAAIFHYTFGEEKIHYCNLIWGWWPWCVLTCYTLAAGQCPGPERWTGGEIVPLATSFLFSHSGIADWLGSSSTILFYLTFGELSFNWSNIHYICLEFRGENTNMFFEPAWRVMSLCPEIPDQNAT